MSDPIAPFLAQFPGPIRLRSPLWWRRAVVWSIIWEFFGLVVMTHVFPVGLIIVIVGAIGPWWLASAEPFFSMIPGLFMNGDFGRADDFYGLRSIALRSESPPSMRRTLVESVTSSSTLRPERAPARDIWH
jgi:hypothetical protein